MSWRTVLGLVLITILGILTYSYYRLRSFSDDIYGQLAQAGVRSITVVNVVRPEDASDPQNYWLEQSKNFSEQLLEGVAGLPIKIDVKYWTPSNFSSAQREDLNNSVTTFEDQLRVMSNFRSDDFPALLSNYPDTALSYNFLRIWGLDRQSDLTFYLDPRALSQSNSNNMLLNTIAVSVKGISLTNRIFQYLLIPHNNDNANGILFINKHLILSSKDQPQPEALKRLMLSRFEYSKGIIEKMFLRSKNLESSSFDSYMSFLKERVELYIKKGSLPFQEAALVNWISGNTALDEYKMDYNFGDLYSQLIPPHDKKSSKHDEHYWSANLLKESLGPDTDISVLMTCLLLEQDLHHISEKTSDELLNALQNHRQQLENELPENQQKILKDFVHKLFNAEISL